MTVFDRLSTSRYGIPMYSVDDIKRSDEDPSRHSVKRWKVYTGRDRELDEMDQPTGLLALGVEQIRQYPGPEQVELKVEVDVPPGLVVWRHRSWFTHRRRAP